MSTPGALRILMVDSEYSWRGGQAQVFLLMRGMVEAGQRVALAAPGNGALYARSAELGVERFPWSGRGPRGVLALRRLLRADRFDVVHTHASRAHGAVALAGIGARARPVHVVSRRVDFAVGTSPWGRWKYHRGADAYIAISNGVRDVLLAGGVDAGSITVVPSGIDLEKFARVRDPSYLRDEFALGHNSPVIVNVAALAPHKAQSVLLEALARLRDRAGLRCFIVGEGTLRASLERMARDLRIDSMVTFTGFRTDALEFIRLADVFVMSSRLEGLGTSIMDAQALGAPVVATRTGGIPELIDDGVTGLLVPPGQAPARADAIGRMLDDAELRAAMARAAKARAGRYDYRHTVYKTLDVYRRLCHVDTPLEGNSSR
ncbi:MAG TPA: glycosyltransferase [Candidatus Krumholzibacteria bacterium]